MHREMTGMTNEEMFTTIISHMDSLETSMTGLSGRMDNLETSMTGLSGRMDNLETSMTGLSGRVDNLETAVTGLTGRMDKVETAVTGLTGRIDDLESNMDMEFYAVRIEMDVLNQSLKKDISIVNDKVDRLMYTKDVEGYENMKIQVDLLTLGYQELKEKFQP